MPEQIDIALCFDAAYSPHAAVVIGSVVRNSPSANLRFIVLHPGLTPEIRDHFETLAGGARFVWCEVLESDLPLMPHTPHRISREALFRLLLEQLAPADCKRVLYLDSDVVVLGDVREIWGSDLGGHIFGAVVDVYLDGVEFARKWRLPDVGPRPYFNSGVLLIDLEQVRAEKAFSRAVAFAITNWEELEHGDQDALNCVFWGKWQRLDPAWNVQRFVPRKELPRADWGGRGAPALVHFITDDKPWTPNVWHPWAWLYWDGLKRTPFAAPVARRNKMNTAQLLRLRLRWWLRRPPGLPLMAATAGAHGSRPVRATH
jgi:lipopolysaccharide biosynthesis glycosyltransferase